MKERCPGCFLLQEMWFFLRITWKRATIAVISGTNITCADVPLTQSSRGVDPALKAFAIVLHSFCGVSMGR